MLTPLRLTPVYIALLLFFAASPCALAVSMDKSSTAKDDCAVTIGADVIQISGYQPDLSRDKYCAEFPATGRVILSFDLVAPRLRDLPIEIRIVKDPLAPLDETADLGPLTEAYLAPRTYKGGTIALDHAFRDSGHFIGLATVIEPSGERKTARFKFSVGQTLFNFVPLVLGGALIAGLLFVYWRHGAKRAPR